MNDLMKLSSPLGVPLGIGAFTGVVLPLQSNILKNSLNKINVIHLIGIFL
jgi:hypothetical protein